jgi:hypothetical protein
MTKIKSTIAFFLIFFGGWQLSNAKDSEIIDFDHVFSEKTSQPRTKKNLIIYIDSKEASSLVEDQSVPSGALTQAAGRVIENTLKDMANNSDSENFCYTIKNDDSKNSCIAKTKRKEADCHAIHHEDTRNSCIAQIRGSESYCHTINNENMKSSCIAIVRKSESYCHTVELEDMKNSCIAQTRGDESYCHTINNVDRRNACIALVKGL